MLDEELLLSSDDAGIEMFEEELSFGSDEDSCSELDTRVSEELNINELLLERASEELDSSNDEDDSSKLWEEEGSELDSDWANSDDVSESLLSKLVETAVSLLQAVYIKNGIHRI